MAEPEGTGDDELKNIVFSNPVIWRKLGSFLNVQDLKNCRLVSRNFNETNEKVTGDTSFKDRAAVTMPGPEFLRRKFGEPKIKYKHLSLDASYYLKYQSKGWWTWLVERFDHPLSSFLDSIESLKLSKGPSSSGMTADFWISWPHYLLASTPLFFVKLFGALKNCRKLSIDIRYFCEFPPSAFDTLEDLGQRLTELEFTCTGGEYNANQVQEAFAVVQGFSTKIQNLYFLKCKLIFLYLWRPRPQDDYLWLRVLVDIVKRNKKMLARLELEEPLCWRAVLWELQNFEMAFPNLKSVKLNYDPSISNTGFILDFLRAQPVLEDIDIQIRVGSNPEILKKFRENITSLKIHRVRIQEIQ